MPPVVYIGGMINDGHRWMQAEAIDLCKEIESFAPDFGFHVALTGGCLYRSGSRPDLDLILYRDNRSRNADPYKFLVALHERYPEANGQWTYDGWRYVVMLCGKKIDILFNYPKHP